MISVGLLDVVIIIGLCMHYGFWSGIFYYCIVTVLLTLLVKLFS